MDEISVYYVCDCGNKCYRVPTLPASNSDQKVLFVITKVIPICLVCGKEMKLEVAREVSTAKTQIIDFRRKG